MARSGAASERIGPTTRAEVNSLADGIRLGSIHWDEVDDRTWVGRSDLGYVVVVTSVLLPEGEFRGI